MRGLIYTASNDKKKELRREKKKNYDINFFMS